MSVNEEQLDEVEQEGEYLEYMDSLTPNGIYLSGPIRCVEDNGIEWREEVIEDNSGLDFNNPLENYSPETEDILSDPAHLDEDSDRRQVLPSEYVTEDKIMINKSDAVLLGLSENIARGSVMEAMYAYLRGVPVFVWTIDGQLESGWLYDHAEYIDSDREAVLSQIRKHLNDNE